MDRSVRPNPVSPRWRAWYEDGSVYSCADVPWRELPAEGIVGVVVYREPPYRQIIDGGDWYWIADDEVRRVMTHEEWGQFAPAPKVGCLSCLKRSGVMDDDAFAEVQREMMAAREPPR
jgi:hypothetical protein